MNDRSAAQRVVDAARRVAPGVPLFMRAHCLAERDALQRLGATDVMTEEVEGGIELMARLLRNLAVPRNVIERCVAEAQAATQASERLDGRPRRTLGEHPRLDEIHIESVLVSEGNPATLRSTVELGVRQQTGALIVAIRGEGSLIAHPEPHLPFSPATSCISWARSKRSTRPPPCSRAGTQPARPERCWVGAGQEVCPLCVGCPSPTGPWLLHGGARPPSVARQGRCQAVGGACTAGAARTLI